MEELEKKFLLDWGAIRSKGKVMFALKEGVTKGALFSVAIELGQVVFKSGQYTFDINRNLIRLTLFVTAYFLYGLWKWRANEKRYSIINKNIPLS